MATTIALQEDTLEILKKLKSELGAETYDSTIRKMLSKARTPEKSMFGKLKARNDFKRDKASRY